MGKDDTDDLDNLSDDEKVVRGAQWPTPGSCHFIYPTLDSQINGVKGGRIFSKINHEWDKMTVSLILTKW